MPCSLTPVKNLSVLGSSAVTPTLFKFPLWIRKQLSGTGPGMSNLKRSMSGSGPVSLSALVLAEAAVAVVVAVDVDDIDDDDDVRLCDVFR